MDNPRQLVQVDVFTQHPLEGNPLAVFVNGNGLTTERMQAIAREMNLSETTFIFSPEDSESDARVRIFTPLEELPFAGHPTIGTAYVLAERTGKRELRLHEDLGIIAVRVEDDGRLFMRFPPPRIERTFDEAAPILDALGLHEGALLPGAAVQVAGSGVPFLYVPLRDAAAVDAAQLDAAAMLGAAGDYAREVFVYAPNGRNRLYSRMFAPLIGIPEDPATGGASGPLMLLACNAGLASGGDPIEAVSEQGTKMGRRSFVHLRRYADGRIEIGGHVVPVMTGSLTISAS